jgi:hypothetical protein
MDLPILDVEILALQCSARIDSDEYVGDEDRATLNGSYMHFMHERLFLLTVTSERTLG